MATGSAALPTMYPVDGFRLGTASAGIKTPGRKDLVVMAVDAGSTVAGLFTQMLFVQRRLLLPSNTWLRQLQAIY